MSDYDDLRHFTALTNREVYRMISELSDRQYNVFCEALDKLCTSPDVDMRKALFIAKSYPIEEKKKSPVPSEVYRVGFPEDKD